jgi:hypothetical protein
LNVSLPILSLTILQWIPLIPGSLNWKSHRLCRPSTVSSFSKSIFGYWDELSEMSRPQIFLGTVADSVLSWEPSSKELTGCVGLLSVMEFVFTLKRTHDKSGSNQR